MSSTNATPRTGFRPNLRTISWVLEVIGLLITGYMTYNKFAGTSLICSNQGIVNCDVVENSAWSWILGFPTAGWGLISHLMITSLLILETLSSRYPENRVMNFFNQYGVMLVFGVALFAALYHTYLIYVSLFILRAICPWCLSAATIMYLQLITTGLRMRAALASES